MLWLVSAFLHRVTRLQAESKPGIGLQWQGARHRHLKLTARMIYQQSPSADAPLSQSTARL